MIEDFQSWRDWASLEISKVGDAIDDFCRNGQAYITSEYWGQSTPYPTYELTTYAYTAGDIQYLFPIAFYYYNRAGALPLIQKAWHQSDLFFIPDSNAVTTPWPQVSWAWARESHCTPVNTANADGQYSTIIFKMNNGVTSNINGVTYAGMLSLPMNFNTSYRVVQHWNSRHFSRQMNGFQVTTFLVNAAASSWYSIQNDLWPRVGDMSMVALPHLKNLPNLLNQSGMATARQYVLMLGPPEPVGAWYLPTDSRMYIAVLGGYAGTLPGYGYSPTSIQAAAVAQHPHAWTYEKILRAIYDINKGTYKGTQATNYIPPPAFDELQWPADPNMYTAYFANVGFWVPQGYAIDNQATQLYFRAASQFDLGYALLLRRTQTTTSPILNTALARFPRPSGNFGTTQYEFDYSAKGRYQGFKRIGFSPTGYAVRGAGAIAGFTYDIARGLWAWPCFGHTAFGRTDFDSPPFNFQASLPYMNRLGYSVRLLTDAQIERDLASVEITPPDAPAYRGRGRGPRSPR